ncbi:MAG: hypothetical protein ACYC5A_03900 [Thermoleophilia bacterium]
MKPSANSKSNSGSESQTAPDGRARAIDEAILRSLCYSDIFSYPLRLKEIVRFSTDVKMTIDEAADRLSASEPLQALVGTDGEFYFLEGRGDNCPLRRSREAESRQQLAISQRRLVPLQGIPFLRMAAVTGALAALNAPAGDDVDLLIISSRNRTWTTYFFLRLWRRYGHNPDFCFNVFLSEGDLVFRKENFFYAREILGARPIYNMGSFERFLEANPWIYDIFPSYDRGRDRQKYHIPRSPVWVKRQRLMERLLAGIPGDIFEFAIRTIQSRRLHSSSPGASMSMRRNRIKLHKRDNRSPIMVEFDNRLEEWLARYRELAGPAIRPV